MLTIQGQYFDGRSSKPFDTEIMTHERDALIVFRTPGGTLQQWRVHDLTYEYHGSYLEIRHKSSRSEFLQIDDQVYVDRFFGLLKAYNRLSVYQRLVNLGVRGALFIALFVFAVIGVGYFVVLPWTAERAVELIPESYDKELGEMIRGTVYDANEVDSAATEVMNRFVACFNWDNRTDLQVVVVKSDVINAFALPDGHIVVFSGLLDKMESYEELVGLIGHEVAHVNNRHSMKMLARDLAGYLFISVVFTDINAVVATFSEYADHLQSLTYSRRFEHEADADGAKLAMQNGVDPRGMIALFERLKEDDTTMTIPAFMSTHPYAEDRMGRIARLIEQHPHRIHSHPEAVRLFDAMKK